MKIHNEIVQGTPEWFAIRKMKMTASNATAIGNNSKGLETYINKLMAEAYAITPETRYTNSDTEAGHELEPLARELYEMETGSKVEEVGFIELDEYVGCSPDGLVGVDGMIEIKSLNNANYFDFLLQYSKNQGFIKSGISGYEWQVQMELYIAGRSWCDLILFNPNYEKSMIIQKIFRDDRMIEKLQIGIEEGRRMIKNILFILNNEL